MSIAHLKFPVNSTTQIPAVGFGTYLIEQDDAAEAVQAAISAGYRHVDTAAVYNNEQGVGEGIRRGLASHHLRRDDLFVTTKLWPGAAEWGEKPKTFEQTLEECENSLHRLGLNYVDLYLIHSPHGGTQRLNEWKALLELQKMGKARGIGVSNYAQIHLDEIEAAGLPLPDVNQIELHPWSQKTDLIRYMHDRSITPIAYSSLAPLSTWRTGAGQESAKPDELKAGDNVFAAMAASYGVTEAQFLLRWGIQNGYAVLPKSLNPVRMRQNLDLGGFEIKPADMDLIRQMDRGAGIAWSMGDPTQVS